MPNYKNYKKNYFLNYNYDIKNLKPMEKSKIVCGKKYGLPFEYLMTDIYSGFLNLNSVLILDNWKYAAGRNNTI